MKTRTLGIVIVIAVVAVAAVLVAVSGVHRPASASSFEGQVIKPGAFAVADYAGKPLVVNVFGSWCPPCNAEAPDLATFAKSNPGAQVVGIASRGHPEGGRGLHGPVRPHLPARRRRRQPDLQVRHQRPTRRRSSTTPTARKSTASSARPPWTSSTPRWPRRSDARRAAADGAAPALPMTRSRSPPSA